MDSALKSFSTEGMCPLPSDVTIERINFLNEKSKLSKRYDNQPHAGAVDRGMILKTVSIYPISDPVATLG